MQRRNDDGNDFANAYVHPRNEPQTPYVLGINSLSPPQLPAQKTHDFSHLDHNGYKTTKPSAAHSEPASIPPSRNLLSIASCTPPRQQQCPPYILTYPTDPLKGPLTSGVRMIFPIDHIKAPYTRISFCRSTCWVTALPHYHITVG